MARKKTKIVCTMGPATESDEVLRELILAGMNVARFNFSHGSHEYHRTMIGRVRSISDELGIPIAIMLDTKGPEVRTGLLEDGKKVTLTTGDSVIVTTDDDVIGNAQRFSLDYKNLPKEVLMTVSLVLRLIMLRALTCTARSSTVVSLARRRA